MASKEKDFYGLKEPEIAKVLSFFYSNSWT